MRKVELIDHNGNKNLAAQKLGISRRQVDRLIIIYKEKGKSGFVHGNRGRKPQKTLDKSISKNIIVLYKNKYYDFNFNHFKKFFKTKENIFVSYKFIYNTLTKEGILSPKTRKKTKLGYAKNKLLEEKKINLDMSKEQINTIVNHRNWFRNIFCFWTFQSRLIQELRLKNITTIEEANKYLTEVFVPEVNKEFALDYKKFPTVFKTHPSEEKINSTLAVLSPRKIDNGNSIKYKNKYYQPYINNELKCFSSKTKCLVIKAFNGDLLVAIDEQVLELRELSRNERFSNNFDNVVKR